MISNILMPENIKINMESTEQEECIAELVEKKTSHLKLQFQYWHTDPTADDADIDVELGYCYIYIFDLEKGNFTMEYRKVQY